MGGFQHFLDDDKAQSKVLEDDDIPDIVETCQTARKESLRVEERKHSSPEVRRTALDVADHLPKLATPEQRCGTRHSERGRDHQVSRTELQTQKRKSFQAPFRDLLSTSTRLSKFRPRNHLPRNLKSQHDHLNSAHHQFDRTQLRDSEMNSLYNNVVEDFGYKLFKITDATNQNSSDDEAYRQAYDQLPMDVSIMPDYEVVTDRANIQDADHMHEMRQLIINEEHNFKFEKLALDHRHKVRMRKVRAAYGRLKQNVVINLQIYDIMNEYRNRASLGHALAFLKRHRRHSVILKTVALSRETLSKQTALRKLKWNLKASRETVKKVSHFRDQRQT